MMYSIYRIEHSRTANIKRRTAKKESRLSFCSKYSFSIPLITFRPVLCIPYRITSKDEENPRDVFCSKGAKILYRRHAHNALNMRFVIRKITGFVEDRGKKKEKMGSNLCLPSLFPSIGSIRKGSHDVPDIYSTI